MRGIAVGLLLLVGTAHAENRAGARKHYAKALAHINLGQHAEAIGEFEAAYLEAPLPSLLYNIAREYETLGAEGDVGNLRKSVEFYKRYLAALKSAPDRAEVEERVKSIEARVASAMEAARAPKQAEAVRSETEKAAANEHAQAGLRLYNVGDFGKAREEYKAAYLAVADPAYLFQIGQCSRQMGDLDEALRAYRTYQRDRPDAPNRGEVETILWDLEETLQQRAAAANGKPQAEPPPKSRGWVVAVVAAVVAVVAGVGIGIGVALSSRPHDAPDPMTTAGVMDLRF
jgi:tetratricopeptide (TPR) repeat protein